MAASAVTLMLVVAVAGPAATGAGDASPGGFTGVALDGPLGGPGTASAGPVPAAGLRVGAISADLIRRREWWLSAVQATAAWKWSKGKGVTVAVLDTGVDARHPDLTGQVITGEDFTGGVRRPGNKYWGRHGSAMAGIIAGHGHGDGMSAGVMGVAPQAKVLSIRVTWENDDPLRAGGTEVSGNRDAVAKGIRYAVDHGANIINMSLGGGKLYYNGSSTEEDAIRYALSKGVVLIASAGNDGAGLNRKNFPAAYPGVLAVGAVERNLRPWRNSNRHDYVKVAAPGVEIVSADAGGGYVLGTGTSPSAAIVAGVAALIRSRYPNLTSVQVAEAMAEGATRDASAGATQAIGAGVTDAVKALYAASRINKPTTERAVAPPPPAPQTQARTSAGGPSLLLIGVLAAGVVLVVIGVVLGWLQRRRRDEDEYEYEDEVSWPGEEHPPYPSRAGEELRTQENGWANGTGRPISGAHRPYEPDAPSPWQSGNSAAWSHAGETRQGGSPHDFGGDPGRTGVAPGPPTEPPAVDESWRSARPVRRRPEVFGHPAVPLEEQPTGAFSPVPAHPEELPTGAFFAVPALPEEEPTGAFYAVPEAIGEGPTGEHLSLPDDHTTAAFAPPPESVNDEPTTAFRTVAPDDSSYDDPVGTPPSEPAGGPFGASPAEHVGDPLSDPLSEPLNDPLGDRPPGEPVDPSFTDQFGNRVDDSPSDPLSDPLDDRVSDPPGDPLSDPLSKRVNDVLSDPLGKRVNEVLSDPLGDRPAGGGFADPLGPPLSGPPPGGGSFAGPLNGGGSFGDPQGRPFGDPLNDPLADPLNGPAGEAPGDPVRDALGGATGGVRQAPWLDPADDEGHRLPWR